MLKSLLTISQMHVHLESITHKTRNLLETCFQSHHAL